MTRYVIQRAPEGPEYPEVQYYESTGVINPLWTHSLQRATWFTDPDRAQARRDEIGCGDVLRVEVVTSYCDRTLHGGA